MSRSAQKFQESGLLQRPLRSLGLTIQGTELEGPIQEVTADLERAGIVRLKPVFYLSTEWGVPFETIAVAIPFYLASPELTAHHAEQVGHVEGYSRRDIVRYLRHELGHVVNYAYRLYDRRQWVEQFGAMSQPYLEEYRPQPFSKRYVRHLPGWYAQKHPDEDWAETFAVWLTPGAAWRTEYAHWPRALAKLELCDEIMREVGGQEPLVTSTLLDEDVQQIDQTIEQLYAAQNADDDELPGLDGSLRTIFEDIESIHQECPAAPLLRKLERSLMRDVFLWTGHFPERTRRLVRHLSARAEALGLVYEAPLEAQVIVGITTLVTALAMNHVHSGRYFV